MKRSHVFLAVVVCLMFAGATVGLFMFEPAAGAREPLLILVGALAAQFGAVVQYWFGSSAGSARKSELMAQRGEP